EGAATPPPQPQTFSLAVVRESHGAAVELSGRRRRRPPGQPDDSLVTSVVAPKAYDDRSARWRVGVDSSWAWSTRDERHDARRRINEGADRGACPHARAPEVDPRGGLSRFRWGAEPRAAHERGRPPARTRRGARRCCGSARRRAGEEGAEPE